MTSTIRSLAVLGALLSAAAARAATPAPGGGARDQEVGPVGVHLSWVRDDAAADCPDAAAIEALVASRLGDNPFQRAPTQFIEATVTRRAEALQVTIAMRGADGKLMGNRTLASASGNCRSIANAAALTIAILIDPDALIRPATASPPPPPSPAPAALGPPPAAPTGPGGRFVVAGEGTWGLLPQPALGVAISATVEIARRAAVGIQGAFLPERRTLAPNDGFAFGLSTGELDGCFVPIDGARLRGEVCGGLSAGLLHTVVYTPTPLGPGERWTFAATQLMRLVIPVFRAGVLEIGAELAEPFPRRSFFIEGQPAGMDTVFTQPASAVTVSVGLGLRWK